MEISGFYQLLTRFGTLAVFPACTAFLPVPHREQQLVGAPSPSLSLSLDAWLTSRGVFGIQELANLKAVLMCFMTFTKSSSGLSGCQCCMICIEHVFHSQGRTCSFSNVSKPFSLLWVSVYTESHSVCFLTCSSHQWTPVIQRE